MDPSLLTFGEAMIDSNLATELVNLVKTSAELFNVWPINVFLYGSLVCLGFVMFRKAKGVAKT